MAKWRSLRDLIGSASGRAFLATNGVYVDAADFVRALTAPADVGLAARSGLADSDRRLVYTAHQISADYESPVMAKFAALQALAQPPAIAPLLVFVDTDRCGADARSMTIAWRSGATPFNFRLARKRHRSMETRFAPVSPERPGQLVAHLRRNVGSASRLEVLAERLSSVQPDATLAEVNGKLTSFILDHCLGARLPSVLISDLTSEGLLTDAITAVVERIDDVVTVFNQAVERLRAEDIDPQVHLLDEDHLPLNYSCPQDGRRLRLRHRRSGIDRWASATCLCGAEYRFWLGSRSVTLDEIVATGRWSPDVTLLIYLNDLVSGVVAGRSSALYGIVLNAVAEKVLGCRAVPALVPAELGLASTCDGVDSALYRCLRGDTA